MKEDKDLQARARQYKTSNVMLQPLRITEGWTVQWNHFICADPFALPQEAPEWIHFSEDLAFFVHVKCGLSIDLGWYGGLKDDGFYCVSLANKEEELKSFSSSDIEAVTDVINYFFSFSFSCR